jgi:hypothetical protein
MKYAVAFHGLPRISNRNGVDKWLEIINAYNMDVFIHSWTDDAAETQKQLIEIFNPKSIKCETGRDFGIKAEDYPRRVFPTVVPHNVFSAHTSFFESMQLVCDYTDMKGWEYDFVIKGRFDAIPGHLEFDYPSCIAVPVDPLLMMKKYTWRLYKEVYAINDLIALGPQHLMKLYANSIYWLDYFYNVDGLDMCSELMIGANLARQFVPVVQRLGIPVIVR